MTTLYATFDGQVLRPDEPIALPPNTRVRLLLEPAGDDLAAQQDTRKPLTDAEQQAARERFERHFGEVDLGYATGVDNEQIDADLARAYAATHKGD